MLKLKSKSKKVDRVELTEGHLTSIAASEGQKSQAAQAIMSIQSSNYFKEILSPKKRHRFGKKLFDDAVFAEMFNAFDDETKEEAIQEFILNEYNQ
jgi:hypothetical protein